jgi:hypothetical protein
VRTRARWAGLAAGVAAALLLAACSHAVTTQADAESRIDAGAALNARPGTYRVGRVTVRLEKVVSLPEDRLGLRFAFRSGSASCCSLFPRIALEQDPAASPGPTPYVVILRSTVDRGILRMRLSDQGGATVPFTMDLRRLRVRLSEL